VVGRPNTAVSKYQLFIKIKREILHPNPFQEIPECG